MARCWISRSNPERPLIEMNQLKNKMVTLGWREWISLPELGLASLKAKVDTGARTSALHAFELREFEQDGRRRVAFKIHPLPRSDEQVAVCEADVIDERVVRDSGGHQEKRLVIRTPMVLGAHQKDIEMTLTARDDMLFRVLLGRTALQGWARVDPARSYLVGRRPGGQGKED
jgi:hypothetical protein